MPLYNIILVKILLIIMRNGGKLKLRMVRFFACALHKY